jgi:hypothetical protein
VVPELVPPLVTVPATPELVPPFPPDVAVPPSCEPLEPALAMPPRPLVDSEPAGSDGDEHAAETTASAANVQSAPGTAARRVKGISYLTGQCSGTQSARYAPRESVRSMGACALMARSADIVRREPGSHSVFVSVRAASNGRAPRRGRGLWIAQASATSFAAISASAVSSPSVRPLTPTAPTTSPSVVVIGMPPPQVT